MIKVILSQPSRLLGGLVNSIFKIMSASRTSPDYTSISQRARAVGVRCRALSKGLVRLFHRFESVR